ncbi:TPA: hypothetical protein ACG6GE_005149, partial [Escherichia coli]
INKQYQYNSEHLLIIDILRYHLLLDKNLNYKLYQTNADIFQNHKTNGLNKYITKYQRTTI